MGFDATDYTPAEIEGIVQRLQEDKAALLHALTAVNSMRNIRNGMADLFHVVYMKDGHGKEISIGNIIDDAFLQVKTVRPSTRPGREGLRR